MEIVEAYRDWTPPRWVRRSTEALVSSVPRRYHVGLRSIVLTNTAALTGHRKRRKVSSSRGKFGSERLLGLHHPAGKRGQAWLELFVDNIFSGHPPYVLRLGFFRKALLAEVLFHEWGHHIHAMQRPEFRDGEDVADAWARRLGRRYFRRRYWYLVPFGPIFRQVGRRLDRKARRLDGPPE